MDKIKEYIRSCRKLGYADKQIRKGLNEHGYPKKVVDRAFSSLDLGRTVRVGILAVLFIFGAIAILKGPAFIGLVVQKNQSITYSQVVNLSFTQTAVYEWTPEVQGDLVSVRLDGVVQGAGNVTVLLIGDNQSYVVYQSSHQKQGLSLATGRVVQETGGNRSKRTNLSVNPGQANASPRKPGAGKTGVIAANTNETATSSIPNQSGLNKQTLKEGLLRTSSLAQTSSGNEVLGNASQINRAPSNNSLLKDTRINNSLENVTQANETLSNGSIVNESLGNRSILPGNESTPQQMNRSNHTTTTSPAIAPNNLTNKGTVQGRETVSITFAGACEETCLLPHLNKSKYILEIRLENASLTLTRITYSMERAMPGNESGGMNASNATKYGNWSIPLGNETRANASPQNRNESLSNGNLTNISLNVSPEALMNLTLNKSANISLPGEKNFSIAEPVSQVIVGKAVRWKQTIMPEANVTKLLPTAFNISSNASSQLRVLDHGKMMKLKIEDFNRARRVQLLEKKLGRLQQPIRKGKAKVIAKELRSTAKLLKLEKAGPIGNVSADFKSTDNLSIVLENATDPVTITYLTEGPELEEKALSDDRKIVTISSLVHYKDILAFTSIREAKSDQIHVYWLDQTSRRKQEIRPVYQDTNKNGMIDRLEWVVPHLSNESYEVSITILNLQSYPTVGGNWVVEFTTSGTANLSITGSNGTRFGVDLEHVSLKCGSTMLSPEYDGTRVSYVNYSCNETGYHTVKVLSKGRHTQKFMFGDAVAYAHNLAGNLPKTLNIQGKLTYQNGTTVNTSTNMSFRLYDVFTGGAALWEENHTAVSVSEGVYDVILGQTQTLSLNFSIPYYLGIVVGGDSEMSPRINLTNSPYSYRTYIAEESLNVTCSDCLTGSAILESSLTGVDADTLDSIDSTGFCQSSGANCPAGAGGSASPWANNTNEIYPAAEYPGNVNISGELRVNNNMVIGGAIQAKSSSDLIING